MPNRILRAGINSSDRVNQLDCAEEVFYRRLMSVVDDYGLFDARPSILRAQLFPLRIDRVREADISRWLAACEKAGLILLYEADEKQFLWMLNTEWAGRAEPKFPLPPNTKLEKTGKSFHLKVTARNCTQLHAIANSRAQVRLYSDSDSNSDSNSNPLSRAREAPVESKNPPNAQQQAAEISGLVAMLRGLYGVTDSTGVHLNDQISTLAIELHGAGIDQETVQGFWDYRTVKPQLWPSKRFVGDCLAWRAGGGKGSHRNGSAHVGASNGQVVTSKNWNPPAEPEMFAGFRAAICEQVEPSAYSTWFAPVRFTNLDDQTLIVRVPDAVFGDWILNNYRDAVQAALQSAGLVDVADLRFVEGE